MDNVNYILEQIQKDNSINTYLNNKEAFREFYFNNMSIWRFGTKVIDIYAYMLSYELDDEDISLYKSQIFKDFYDYEQDVTQNPYFKDCEIDDNYINKFGELISNYMRLNQFDKEKRMLDFNVFIRDITASMIVCLNKAFFKLSDKNNLKMISAIRNNVFLEQLIQKEDKMNWMDENYLFQYITRFLFMDEVVNVDGIKDDMLINALKNGKIKNKEIVKKIIKLVSVYHIEYIFDNLSSFIDMLEKYFESEYERKDMFKIIYDKLIQKKEYIFLGKFIMHDERSKLYLYQEEINNILTLVYCEYLEDMDEIELKYMLNHKDQGKNLNIVDMMNLRENLKNNKWGNKFNEILNNGLPTFSKYDYTIQQALDVLDKLFHKQKVNELQVFGAMRRIIKEYLQDEEIRIFLVATKKYNGCANFEQKIIKLDIKKIQEMINCSDLEQNPSAIHILETMFHEARHIEQYKKMEQDIIPENYYKMYKECVITDLSSEYYDKNYHDISFEKDARVEGKRLLIEMLQKYFPYMTNCIKFYEKKLDEELNKNKETKKMFELSDEITIDEILKKIIFINPSILQNNKHLKLEYKNFEQCNETIQPTHGKTR